MNAEAKRAVGTTTNAVRNVILGVILVLASSSGQGHTRNAHMS